MRPRLLILFTLILATAALASAQASDPPLGDPVTVPRGSLDPSIFGPLRAAQEVVPVALEPVEMAPTQGVAADACEDAEMLALATYGTAGDISDTSLMTTAPSDPVLSCVWGQPQDPRGFRTVWYKFKPAVSGRLLIQTSFNPAVYDDSYDTVLTLYRSSDGTCATLAEVACNDDHTGFLSEVAAFVTEGVTYYIEVADWQFAADGAQTLRLAVVLDEGESFWQSVESYWTEARSRHIVVTDGDDFYVIAGEEAVEPDPQRDSLTRRYDPDADSWEELYPMPGPDSRGYSRTSAAYLNGRIYVPSGYVGNNAQYDGAHWLYDIAADAWTETVTPVPWPNGVPYAWHQAVAAPQSGGYFLTGGLVSGDPDPTYPADAVPTGRFFFFAPDANGVTGFWNTNLPSMSIPRYAHVAALLNTPQGRKICVAGGLTRDPNAPDPAQATVLNSAECFFGGVWTPIAPLRQSRFSAGSAVGPDGRWYVFGGVRPNLEATTSVEVYDPVANTWQVLDSRYSLRRPGRAWPRGDFIDNTLYIFGGEEVPGNEVVPLVEKLFIPTQGMMLPFVGEGRGTASEPNNVLAQAIPIYLNQPQWHDFAAQDDFFDVFRFEVPSPGTYAVTVSSIPEGHNYDIYLVNPNKYPIGFGRKVGNVDDQAITLPVGPGTGYALVVRVEGPATTDLYRVEYTKVSP